MTIDGLGVEIRYRSFAQLPLRMPMSSVNCKNCVSSLTISEYSARRVAPSLICRRHQILGRSIVIRDPLPTVACPASQRPLYGANRCLAHCALKLFGRWLSTLWHRWRICCSFLSKLCLSGPDTVAMAISGLARSCCSSTSILFFLSLLR